MVAGRYATKRTFDDCLSAAYLGLCRAAVYWDGRGNFGGWADILMRQEVWRELRQRARLRGKFVAWAPQDEARYTHHTSGELAKKNFLARGR